MNMKKLFSAVIMLCISIQTNHVLASNQPTSLTTVTIPQPTQTLRSLSDGDQQPSDASSHVNRDVSHSTPPTGMKRGASFTNMRTGAVYKAARTLISLDPSITEQTAYVSVIFTVRQPAATQPNPNWYSTNRALIIALSNITRAFEHPERPFDFTRDVSTVCQESRNNDALVSTQLSRVEKYTGLRKKPLITVQSDSEWKDVHKQPLCQLHLMLRQKEDKSMSPVAMNFGQDIPNIARYHARDEPDDQANNAKRITSFLSQALLAAREQKLSCTIKFAQH